jgi:hypothetical protein
MGSSRATLAPLDMVRTVDRCPVSNGPRLSKDVLRQAAQTPLHHLGTEGKQTQVDAGSAGCALDGRTPMDMAPVQRRN